jgi:DNA repair and recombination protein RAD54B
VACHTHELLSCPCGTSSSLPPPEEDDIEEPPDKPRRKFIQDDSDEDDEEKGFVVATQIDPDKLSKSVSQFMLYETPLIIA